MRRAPRYIFTQLPTCPQCGGSTFKTMRSEPAAEDGTRARRATCGACGERVVIVAEPSVHPDERIFDSDSKIWKNAKGTCDDRFVELNLLSLGQAAVRVRKNPKRLEQVAEAAGVRPVVRLGGVPYFDARDVDNLARLITGKPEVENVEAGRR